MSTDGGPALPTSPNESRASATGVSSVEASTEVAPESNPESNLGAVPLAKPVDHYEGHLDVTGKTVAVTFLREQTPLSAQRIKDAMTKGAVWLTRGGKTQRLRRAKRDLRPGDRLSVYFDARILANAPPAVTLVADEGAYSVWEKPYGVLSQGSKWGDHFTVVRWAEQHLTPPRSGFVVHRLDRAATGLILVAHEKRAAAKLSNLFRERAVTKHYAAVVDASPAARDDAPRGKSPSRVASDQTDVKAYGEEAGAPLERTLSEEVVRTYRAALERDSRQTFELRLETDLDGRRAITDVLSVERDGTKALVHVNIRTGRKHQIRRHLALVGTPILGDRAYGRPAARPVDLQLTAYYLAFRCPLTGAKRQYQLPVPGPHLSAWRSPNEPLESTGAPSVVADPPENSE